MIPQTEFENKSLTKGTAGPDIEALRDRVASLRSDERRQEAELHAAQSAFATSNSEISLSQANQNSKALTDAVLAHGAAQSRILAAVGNLTTIRGHLSQATTELLHAEGRVAAAEAAALEQEIVAELRDFAGNMARFSQQCTRIRILKEKAQINQHLLTPAVLSALGPNWGEIHSPDAVVSRLDLITKISELPDNAAIIVRTAARERASEAKTEADRARQAEAEQPKRRSKYVEGFEMWIEEGQVKSRVVDLMV